jgi:hypothetical protein
MTIALRMRPHAKPFSLVKTMIWQGRDVGRASTYVWWRFSRTTMRWGTMLCARSGLRLTPPKICAIVFCDHCVRNFSLD